MRFETRILLSILLVGAFDCHAFQQPEPPELIIPPFDAVEKPPVAAKINTAKTTRQEMPQEAIDFVRGIALLLIPQEFEDLFERLLRQRVGRENKYLARRINTAREKKRERLEIPFDIAGWFNAADSKELAD